MHLWVSPLQLSRSSHLLCPGLDDPSARLPGQRLVSCSPAHTNTLSAGTRVVRRCAETIRPPRRPGASSPDQRNLDQGQPRMRSTPCQCGTKGPSERAQPSKRTVHSEHSAFFESLHRALVAGVAFSFLHAPHLLQCAVTLRHRNHPARPSAEAWGC